jgi:hypothetical protein
LSRNLSYNCEMPFFFLLRSNLLMTFEFNLPVFFLPDLAFLLPSSLCWNRSTVSLCFAELLVQKLNPSSWHSQKFILVLAPIFVIDKFPGNCLYLI